VFNKIIGGILLENVDASERVHNVDLLNDRGKYNSIESVWEIFADNKIKRFKGPI